MRLLFSLVPIAATLGCAALAGCAALDPIRGHAPEDVAFGLTGAVECRDCTRTIDLSRLQQPRPCEHLVGPGDTLGVFIEGVLGEEDKGPPVIAPATDRQRPKLGYPVVVRRDGMLTLPFLDAPIAVAGRTVPDVEKLVREAYTGEGGFVKPGGERIFVQLQSPRTTRVLVVRRDRPNQLDQLDATQDTRFTRPARGTSQLVELRAFENDVLHALVASGGLPGPEAENAVYIMRASRGGAKLNTPVCSLDEGQPHAVPSLQPTPAVRPGGEQPARLPQPSPLDAAARGPVLPISYETAGGPSQGGHDLAGLLGSSYGRRDIASQRAIASAGYRGGCVDPAGCVDPSGCVDGVADSFHPARFGMPNAALLNTPRQPAVLGGHSMFLESATNGPIGGHSVFTPQAAHAAEMLLHGDPQSMELAQALLESPHVTRIPLEAPCGAPHAFAPSDVILHDGDVVFIESREREFFYTAGLLGGGKYTLPREESLDVLDALALVDSQRRQLPGRYVGGVSSLSQDVTVGASRLVIYRQVAGKQVVPIELDLNRIKKNPSEAIAIRPGDRLFLEYTAWEAIGASFERFFIEGTVLGISSSAAFGN